VFRSDGWEARADLVQRTRDGWNGAIGVQTLSRSFEAIGAEAFVPGSEIDEAGIYTVQRLDRADWGLEGGLRYDRRTVTATPLSGGAEIGRDFDNWSGSAAAFIKPAANLFLGLSLAHNERAPSEVELFADGLHVATGI
jgi:iron complex outermembrane receptor protein